VTILRAKPKYSKRPFERVIVLEDADPKIVRSRVGSALLMQSHHQMNHTKLKPEDVKLEAQKLMQ